MKRRMDTAFGAIGSNAHCPTNNSELAPNANGNTTPGPLRVTRYETVTTPASETAADRTSMPGSAVTGKLPRKSASRVAFALTWNAIIAPAERTAAAASLSVSVRPRICFDHGLGEFNRRTRSHL